MPTNEIIIKEKNYSLSINSLYNKKILIAEDDETNFFLLNEYLENTGAELIWVKDGKEVVEFIDKNNHFDIILMDIQMPDMDGYEALSIIRPRIPHLPVIALTAFAISGDKEYAINAGF